MAQFVCNCTQITLFTCILCANALQACILHACKANTRNLLTFNAICVKLKQMYANRVHLPANYAKCYKITQNGAYKGGFPFIWPHFALIVSILLKLQANACN